MNILLVEDNSGDAVLIKEYLAEAFKNEQYILLHVVNLANAIDELSQNEYSLILLDLGLPDSKGLPSYQVLNKNFPSVPIIILTGLNDEKSSLEAINDGAQDYIFKGELNPYVLRKSIIYSTERKKIEEHLVHLKNVLNAIKTVNQLITHQRNPALLIREACQKLIEGNSYKYVRIATIDKKNIITDLAYSDSDSEADNAFIENVKSFDDLPLCMKNAYNQYGIILTEGNPEYCKDCTIFHKYPNCYNVSVRLEFENTIYGVLNVSIPSVFDFGGEERSLFMELTRDISFALATIEIENEKNRAELQLQKQYNIISSVLESTESIIFSLDRNYCYTSFNSRHASVMKELYDADIKLGGCFYDYQVAKEETVKSKIIIDRALNGERVIEEVKAGDPERNEIIFEISHNPILNENDEVVGVTVFATDITKRKLAEESLRLSEEKFSLVFRLATYAIVITRASDGKIIEVNDSFYKITGYSRDEIKGKTTLDLNLWADKDERTKLLEALRKDGEVIGLELEFIMKNGNTIIGLISAIQIQMFNETCILVSIADITEIKKYQAELEKSKQKAEEMNIVKSHFFRNMSHEMRTPMIGILGFAKLLMKEVNKEEQRDMARMIVDDGERLMETLNLILDMSSLDTGKQVMVNSEVSIPFAVYDAIEQYASVAKLKNLELKASILDNEVTADLDESLLGKVVNNLLNNAIKFTNKGGITVEVDSVVTNTDKLAVIRVIDSGIGIPAEDLETIFQEFRQGSEGKSRSFEGTGLGLTISKKYVELMGGKISVESQLGVGTTFTISFPAMNYSDKVAEILADETKVNTEEAVNEAVIDVPKVMLVEDDLSSIILEKKYLRDFYEVDSVSNSDKALKLIEELVKNKKS